MSTPYFNRDESIILTAHKVTFDSALSDVMLTSQRIILIDAGYAQFKPQIIPLSTIETVIAGEDAFGNPIVTLSLAAAIPGGATTSKELVFSRQGGIERQQEANDWVKHLKEQIRSVREKTSAPMETPTELDSDIIFDDTIGTETGSGTDTGMAAETSAASHEPGMTIPAVGAGSGSVPVTLSPEQQPAGAATAEPSTPLSSRFHPDPASPGKRSYAGIAAITIVILAVAGIAIMYSPLLMGNSQGSPVPTLLPETPAATTAPTPVPTTIVLTPVTTAATPAPTTQPQVVIPGSGVWVRVQYAGNFAGQIGVSGGTQEVMGSGNRFYQIPTVDGIVAAIIQKQDGSGNVLTVEVYKNGTLAKNGTVSSPRGTVDLHVDLKTV